jgi:chromosome segregation ATPase
MAEQNQKQPKKWMWIAGAALLLAAALVAAYLAFPVGGTHTPLAVSEPKGEGLAPVNVTNQTDGAAQLQNRLGELEKQRQELAQIRGAAFREARDALGRAEMTNACLLAEIRALQQELNAVVDAHPVLVGHRQALQRFLDQAHVTDTNSAAVLTGLHAKQAAARETNALAIAAVQDLHLQARADLLREMGVDQDRLEKMTPEQAERLSQLERENRERIRMLMATAQRSRENPSEEEQELNRSFQQLRQEITEINKQYQNKQAEIPGLRAQVRASDPTAVALEDRLTALHERRRQMLDATPEVVEAQSRYRVAEQKHAELISQIRSAKSQWRTGISEARPMVGRNGQD